MNQPDGNVADAPSTHPSVPEPRHEAQPAEPTATFSTAPATDSTPGQPPTQPSYPSHQPGHPPVQPGFPPPHAGFPPVQPGFPPPHAGFPPPHAGFPPAQPGFPPAGYAAPPAQSGYPYPSGPVPVAQPYAYPAAPYGYQRWVPAPKEVCAPAPNAIYPALLRGPGWKPWRPFASLGAMVGALFALGVVMAIVMVIYMAATGRLESDTVTMGEGVETPISLLGLNLMLAGLGLAGVISIRLAHGVKMKWTLSVAGKFRWRPFWVAGAISLPVLLASLVYDYIQDPLPISPDSQFWAFAAVIALTTPLQCAGEEFLVRGWMTQSIGSFWARWLVPNMVWAVVTALIFMSLHGTQQSLWAGIDRFAFGLAASVLAWRTGGLEAPIAVHSVNNMTIMFLAAWAGQFNEASDDTGGTWVMAVTAVVSQTIICLGVWWWAKKTGLVWKSSPTVVQDDAPAKPQHPAYPTYPPTPLQQWPAPAFAGQHWPAPPPAPAPAPVPMAPAAHHQPWPPPPAWPGAPVSGPVPVAQPHPWGAPMTSPMQPPPPDAAPGYFATDSTPPQAPMPAAAATTPVAAAPEVPLAPPTTIDLNEPAPKNVP